MNRISNTYDSIIDTEIDLAFISQIAIVALNKPKTLNALSQPFTSKLKRTFERIQADPNIKVIILASRVKKGFCAGADITEFKNRQLEGALLDDNLQNVRDIFKGLTKPVIACVHGVALGGGFELALNCDIIVCEKKTRFGFPEIKLGLFPCLGGTLIAKTIGKYRANRYILTGDFISSEEAKEMGFVQFIEKEKEAYAKCIELAKKIQKYSISALIMAKRAIKYSYEESGSQAKHLEKITFNALVGRRGAEEGVNAFIEKRKPDFKDS